MGLSHLRHVVGVFLGVAMFSTSPFAYAAEEEEEQGSSPRRIEEVTVTAERREASISDTSISITAFTAEAIEDFGIRNQEDLQAMVPAAVIEPYDMAIRGVGRNFRSLGGDPGIATYQNGVYSEDFGIASTEGGLFDVERIEFLRGPQGTLYGRNAIGGAVNFINKRPTQDFSGEIRTLVGDYDLLEVYGVVSGPIIPDVLAARLVGMNRSREGYYEDLSGNPDPGDYGDENYALSLLFTPTDDIEMHIRGNERSYRRRMGGADAAGILNISQRGGLDATRDVSTYAWGFRAVDPNILCPDIFTRTPSVPTPGVINGTSCAIAGQEMFQFQNPLDGSTVHAQRVTSGVDKAVVGTTDSPNYAYGHNPALQRLIGISDLEGSDLITDTSGQQDEFFDHQAISMDISWDISDVWGLKYIFGYTDYFYDRESDVDLTSNPLFDRTFYVSQDTIYESHELQVFWDPNDRLSVTGGAFWYTASIRQRGDFYDFNCVGNQNCASRYAQDDPTGILAGIGKVDLFTGQIHGRAFERQGTPLPFNCLTGEAIAAQNQLDYFCFGEWLGDEGDNIPHGPTTIATDLEYQTGTERESTAFFVQGVYDLNEQFALTLGLRWARDELEGTESIFYYAEDSIVPLGFEEGFFAEGGNGCATANCGSSLAFMNQALGFLDADGNIADPNRLLVAGVPASISLYRELSKNTEDMTWRINLDYTPNDDRLIYVSATKGLRSGGFNLVFFSEQGTFGPEELVAFELGYKDQWLDGQLQINAAAYFYDYENVHTFANGVSFSGGYTTNVVPVPAAEMMGVDAEITWLATERLSLGFHGSYTGTEYTEDYFVIDPNDPTQPESLFDSTTNLINLNGNNMIRVPEYKAGMWAMYTLPVSRGTVDFTMSYSYTSRVYYSVFERRDQSADPYDRLDLRVTWNPSDQWLIAAFVNNVFDEIGFRQIEQYGATEQGGWRRTGTPTDPRLYGLEVRYKMGAQ